MSKSQCLKSGILENLSLSSSPAWGAGADLAGTTLNRHGEAVPTVPLVSFRAQFVYHLGRGLVYKGEPIAGLGSLGSFSERRSLLAEARLAGCVW